MARRVLGVALLVASVVGGCHDAPGPGDGDRAQRGGGGPPPASDACASVQERFKARLDRASGACTTDADCGCYNPVHGALGCGGRTDAATAAALRELEAEFHRHGCRWPHQCAPQECEPACVAGRCGATAVGPVGPVAP